MKRNARELGRKLAVQRRAAGLTQEQLAERARLNVKTIQGIEQGRTEPELATMTAIAKALGASLDSLVPSAAPSAEAVMRRMQNDLQQIPSPMLEHVAALLHALAQRKK